MTEDDIPKGRVVVWVRRVVSEVGRDQAEERLDIADGRAGEDEIGIRDIVQLVTRQGRTVALARGSAGRRSQAGARAAIAASVRGRSTGSRGRRGRLAP